MRDRLDAALVFTKENPTIVQYVPCRIMKIFADFIAEGELGIAIINDLFTYTYLLPYMDEEICKLIPAQGVRT